MPANPLWSHGFSVQGQPMQFLAADETIPTLRRRFDTLGIGSTEQSRRTYREMLFTSPGAADLGL
jgi:fructose-bisphosphate aldolase class 1